MFKHLCITRNILVCQAKILQKSTRGPLFREKIRYRSVDHDTIGSRRPCPPPLPPPEPPPKDDTLFWAMCALAMCTTAFGVMAKNNQEVRDWLTIYAPWFDDIIAFAYEENYSHMDYILCKMQAIRDKFDAFWERDECRLDTEGNKILPILEPDVCVKPEPPVVVLDICEIEKCIQELAEESFANIYTAKESCLYYNKLVVESMTELTEKKLQQLEDAMEERKKLIEESLENYNDVNTRLAEMLEYLKCGVKVPEEHKDTTRKMVKFIQEDIKREEIEYLWANDKALAYDRYWQIVAETFNKFTWETKSMYLNLDYSAKRPIIEGSIDPYLIHSYKYITYLKKSVKVFQDNITWRIDRAINGILSKDEKDVKAREALIESETKRLKAELDKTMSERCAELKKRNDDREKRMLAKRQAANEKEIEDKCAAKVAELEGQFDRMLAERLESERKVFKAQRDEVAKQLADIEKILQERLKAEQEIKRCKELWAAGNALLNATKKGDEIVVVKDELKAVAKAGKEDELVGTILKAIPPSVRQEGVTPEIQVLKKYEVMEDVARKVALVETEGQPLPVYILSYFQDVLLFLKLAELPHNEIGRPLTNIPVEARSKTDPIAENAVDLTIMSTFDLLQRSGYFIKNGDIPQALEYVNALEGASYVASERWRNNAQAFLETRQAAEAVIAHAAALGLKNSYKSCVKTCRDYCHRARKTDAIPCI